MYYRVCLFLKAKDNILYVMHIDVLSTKIGIFWKKFALKFVTPQKFENKFWNFLKPTNDQASQLLLYNELSMPGSKILELIFLRKKIMKISWKILWKIFGNFNFWDLAEKCFVETNNREQIFSRFLQNSKKIFPKFVWSVTNLSAKFLQKTPIFVLRTPMCIIYKILPWTFEK